MGVILLKSYLELNSKIFFEILQVFRWIMEKKSEVPLMILQGSIILLIYGALLWLTAGIVGTILQENGNSGIIVLLGVLASLAYVVYSGSIMQHFFPDRIRRLVYIPLIAFILPTLSILMFMTWYNYQSMSINGYKYSIIFYWGLSIILFFASWFLIESRLKDINAGQYVGILFLIPAINIILAIALCFMAGTVGTNQYGEDPRQKGIPKPPTA